MANRRVPLSNVSNVGNSPFKAVAAAASKQSRAYSIRAEAPYGQPPPSKKQIIEATNSNPCTPPRRIAPSAEGRVFSRRVDAQPTAFEKKCIAVKDKSAVARASKPEKHAVDSIETLLQWQSHYRKAFPDFVFYFESVPDDTRRQCLKDIHAFGARQAKFFSKEVTHVITTRPVPSNNESGGSNSNAAICSTKLPFQDASQPRTINPSLLEKSHDLQSGTLKSKFTFESSLSKKLAQCAPQDGESRKNYGSNVDVLQKAKSMGMKIWQLEKLQRMVNVLYDVHEGAQYVHSHNTRSNVAVAPNAPKQGRQTDLFQMIRNEQINGPTDREALLAANELVPLKGPYLYVYDMNEKTKPIMVREYPKVQSRAEGVWPQFRSAANGKCPFIEENVRTRRRYQETERAKDSTKEEGREEERTVPRKFEREATPPRTRTGNFVEQSMQPPLISGRKRALAEMESGANRASNLIQQLPPPAFKPGLDRTSSNPGHHSGVAGLEPMASGLQASNITSAIRSQMISSTAAAPGAKAGISKELHGLQRKVVEKNSRQALGSLGTSKRMTDIAGAGRSRENALPRVAKQRAEEKLGRRTLIQIHEEMTQSDEDEADLETDRGRDAAQKVLKGMKKEERPGYCENCREKFDDFEDHVNGRKHRKFAIAKENWKELDGLLMELVRPLREEYQWLQEETGLEDFDLPSELARWTRTRRQ